MAPQTGADVDHLRERLERRREVFQGRLLRVLVDDVRLPEGGSATREVVQHPGAVAVVAVDDQERVVLVRQWRHAVEGALWEIPAGTCDAEEEAEATARRELAEETGYRAARWTRLGAAYVSPGYADELMTYFLAEDITAGETSTDTDERLDVRLASAPEVAALAADAAVDSKTLAGLALAGRLAATTGAA